MLAPAVSVYNLRSLEDNVSQLRNVLYDINFNDAQDDVTISNSLIALLNNVKVLHIADARPERILSLSERRYQRVLPWNSSCRFANFNKLSPLL